MTTFYRGFSTLNRAKKFRVNDVDLVKQDLLNHFSIRKGERLMDPNFGTVIWSMLYEPMDETTRQIMIDDVTKIVGYDPRVSLTDITVIEQDYGVQIELDLVFLATNQSTSMSLKFDTDAAALSTSGVY
jgi:phage baseplate assembly protein W